MTANLLTLAGTTTERREGRGEAKKYAVKCGETKRLARARRRTNCVRIGNLLILEIMRLLYRLDGEAFAAGSATAFENKAAGVSSHPNQKTMDFGALAFFGLISSFHSPELYHGEIGFVTVIYINGILSIVENLCITWLVFIKNSKLGF